MNNLIYLHYKNKLILRKIIYNIYLYRLNTEDFLPQNITFIKVSCKLNSGIGKMCKVFGQQPPTLITEVEI